MKFKKLPSWLCVVYYTTAGGSVAWTAVGIVPPQLCSAHILALCLPLLPE